MTLTWKAFLFDVVLINDNCWKPLDVSRFYNIRKVFILHLCKENVTKDSLFRNSLYGWSLGGAFWAPGRVKKHHGHPWSNLIVKLLFWSNINQPVGRRIISGLGFNAFSSVATPDQSRCDAAQAGLQSALVWTWDDRSQICLGFWVWYVVFDVLLPCSTRGSQLRVWLQHKPFRRDYDGHNEPCRGSCKSVWRLRGARANWAKRRLPGHYDGSMGLSLWRCP